MLTDRELFSVRQYYVHAGHVLDFVRTSLCIAAGHHHSSIGIESLRPPDHLPRLPVADAGHCAGVDDVYIGDVIRRDYPVAAPLQRLAHHLRLILIHLAAQSYERNAGFWMLGSAHIFLYRDTRISA